MDGETSQQRYAEQGKRERASLCTENKEGRRLQREFGVGGACWAEAERGRGKAVNAGTDSSFRKTILFR